MSHSDQDIPTLNDFIRIGDKDMHHHFDAHQFSIDQEEPWSPTDTGTFDAFNESTFSADTYSNANLSDDKPDGRKPESENETVKADNDEPGEVDPLHIDPLHINQVEVDHVPAELAPFDPALIEDSAPTDETDEYLELGLQEVISDDTPSMHIAADDIDQPQAVAWEATRQQIDQAVDELLPDIAEQLKSTLYRKFRCQSDSD
jgi:hypothetical protein